MSVFTHVLILLYAANIIVLILIAKLMPDSIISYSCGISCITKLLYHTHAVLVVLLNYYIILMRY